MKSKLALSLIAVSAILGCAPPSRGNGTTSPAGGTTATGGTSASGGSGQSGGGNGSGGVGASGGATGSGGSGSGGATPKSTGGTVAEASGGAAGKASGGATGSGSGGQPSGGAGGGAAGGASSAGGTTGTGSGSGGATGAGGSTSDRTGPCDIYQAGNTPCVAAHSTVRALYGAYSGFLYQVRKGGSTKDIPVAADGYVDISVQNTFCSGGTCTISVIYDQSPNKNDLVKSGKALWLPNGGDEANATQGKITINGHTAYGIYVDNSGGTTGVGYRNNATKGLAKNDDPEAMYMVVDGKRYNQWCCFDYGNAETSGKDDGDATMEAMYWGNNTQFEKGAAGNGPWIAADLENGMFECDVCKTTVCSSYTSITGMDFVTGMLKGYSGNQMGLKAGNAQSGKLETKWDGKRPPGYSPMKKQGAIILGTGGDGSNNAKGTFFEGAITSGNSSDATDDAIQANIVAAGYGK
jgi:hypothetical protein